VKDLSRYFSKEDIPKGQKKKNMKICSTSLIIREIQMEATKKYLLTLVRMALTKTSTNNKCEERVWIKGNPHTLLVAM